MFAHSGKNPAALGGVGVLSNNSVMLLNAGIRNTTSNGINACGVQVPLLDEQV